MVQLCNVCYYLGGGLAVIHRGGICNLVDALGTIPVVCNLVVNVSFSSMLKLL